MPLFDWDAPEPEHDPQQTMRFILNRFERLLSEAGGGIATDPLCAPEDIDDPDLDPLPPDLAELYGLDVDASTQGCYGHTRFALSYETEAGHGGIVSACAICDTGVAWPRLAPPAHA